MPSFTSEDRTLNYMLSGEEGAWPVLLLAPGGMRSSIERWHAAPWNPLLRLPEYRVVAMDQRNAGASTGLIRENHGWQTYLEDQLALLDYLGIERFHVVGMCIGGPYALSLCRAVPDRVLSAVLLQPIGEAEQNRSMFYELFDAWANAIRGDHPEADDARWDRFRTAMFGGDFVFALRLDELRAIDTPILVAAGADRYHPSEISRQLAKTARRATLIESWKEDLAQTDAHLRTFLVNHTPTRAS